MKKALVWILVLALLAVASVLGTIAYLKDEATADNVMTVGNVKISLLEFERTDVETPNDTNSAVVQEFSNNEKPLLPSVIEKGFDYTPGDTYVDWEQNDDEGNVIKPNYTSPIWDPAKINNEVDKMVFVKNTGDYSAYVRIYFAFEAGNYEVFEEFQKKIHLNINETDWNFEWIPFVGKSEDSNYFVASAIYPKELAPGEVTEITLSQIALDSSADNEAVAAFGDGYSVKVCAQAIQSEGFGAPKQALNEGFGRGVPFDDIYIEGATMKDALRYLDGDLEGENITNKVTSITFGLNNAYPEIADNYQGTPMNDEQDYYVNVHYVPQGENYNLYVLADGPIYTPVDSADLFYNMQYVETINMDNLNTSRTQDMYCMLSDCYKLSELDLSKWDVRNVTNMYGLLYMCTSLTEIKFEDWETESLTDMSYLLANCSSLEKADVSHLDTGNVTTMREMFYGCGALKSIEGLNKWDTSKVTDMQQMFLGVGAKSSTMTEIDISNFDSSSVTFTSFMFSGCTNLETVRFGENWDMAKVTNANNMFNACVNLQTIYVVKEWDTSKLTNDGAMFNGCINLKGGAGTTFDPAKTNKEYARIDVPATGDTPAVPGYLTQKPAQDSGNS